MSGYLLALCQEISKSIGQVSENSTEAGPKIKPNNQLQDKKQKELAQDITRVLAIKQKNCFRRVERVRST